MYNIRIKAETDSFSTKEYGTYGWPITYFDSAQNLNEKDNCATINLRIDDNTKPILFFENTKLLGKNNHSRFWDEKQLLNGTATDWSNDITLRFPNTGSDRNNVAYYIKLQYFRQEYNPLSPNTVLKNEQYFDSAFCPIDLLNTSNDNNVFQQVHNPSMHYVRGRMPNYTKEFGYFAQNGAYWDKDRVLFYSQIIFPHKTTGHFYSKEKGIDNKFSLESNFFNISFLKKDVNISCSILQEKTGINQYEPFKIISVSHYNGLFGAKENLLLLGLTVEELQSLKDAANAIDQYTHSPRLSDLYRQYVFLEEIPSSPETDKDGILFRKFMLKIQGYTPEGVVSFVETNKKIYVYSRDGLCFTSRDFAEIESTTPIEMCGIQYRNDIRCVKYRGNYGPKYSGEISLHSYSDWKNLILNKKVTIEEKEILIAVSENEGTFDTVQSYDSEIVSVGLMQKTINILGSGELPIQLREFKQINSDKFRLLFENCGWTVDNINNEAHAFYKGKTGQELKDLIRKGFNASTHGKYVVSIPIEPLINACKDISFQEKQIIDYLKRYKEAINKIPTGFTYKIGDYAKSKLSKALVFDNDINRPSQVCDCYAKALNLFFDQNPNVSNNPNNWGTNHTVYEKQINEIYGPLRGNNEMGFSMTNAIKRYNTLKSLLL